MSSTYRVLCLSHDPAVIAADGEMIWYDPEQAETAIAAGIEGHEQCDLAIGRYSYPLFELGCPPSREPRQHQHHCDPHPRTQWFEIEWLRLLALARREPAGSALAAAADARGMRCWPAQRLERLRAELSLPEQVAPRPIRACAKDRVHDAHDWSDGSGWYDCIGFPMARKVPPPCNIAHDCPGQPRPVAVTARGEARCLSQYRPEGGTLVQCARAVHAKGDAHTDYDPDRLGPLIVKPGGFISRTWYDDDEAATRG